jgi:hypothetical protein
MHPGKQRCAVAVLGEDGRYRAGPAGSAAPVGQLLARLAARSYGGAILAGFDFPIGLPARYAKAAGITKLTDFFATVDRRPWPDFFSPADLPREISLQRPFFPRGSLRKGVARQVDVAQMAGCAHISELLRRCDRPRHGRKAAGCMFWTLGTKQVGKGMLAGWKEVVLPARRSGARLWPFEGDIEALLEPGATVLIETYPAEFYDHLGVAGVSKRQPASRQQRGEALLFWAAAAGMDLEAPLVAQIQSGFGPSPDGEDDFDAVVGLFGMIESVLGFCDPMPPPDASVQRVEGWMFGQKP